jgi:hypothetical protein
MMIYELLYIKWFIAISVTEIGLFAKNTCNQTPSKGNNNKTTIPQVSQKNVQNLQVECWSFVTIFVYRKPTQDMRC